MQILNQVSPLPANPAMSNYLSNRHGVYVPTFNLHRMRPDPQYSMQPNTLSTQQTMGSTSYSRMSGRS